MKPPFAASCEFIDLLSILSKKYANINGQNLGIFLKC